jgi:hypothetical protein
MFSALFRRSRPATRPAVRFTPRLEALDGRIAPGGAYGGVLGDARLATASQVRSVGPDHIGEEIPQTGSNHAAVHTAVWGADRLGHPGQVDTFGGMTGGVL